MRYNKLEMSDHKDTTEAQWKTKLTDEQYRVARQKGTERAFTGKYWDCKEDGSYHCICCDTELFRSDEKYDSGSGWPSFWQAAAEDRVAFEEDGAHGMRRIEALCKNCGAHLGHIFPDGPKPTGKRYCINSASLSLKASGGDDT